MSNARPHGCVHPTFNNSLKPTFFLRLQQWQHPTTALFFVCFLLPSDLIRAFAQYISHFVMATPEPSTPTDGAAQVLPEAVPDNVGGLFRGVAAASRSLLPTIRTIGQARPLAFASEGAGSNQIFHFPMSPFTKKHVERSALERLTEPLHPKQCIAWVLVGMECA
jgi:hypothetical protein